MEVKVGSFPESENNEEAINSGVNVNGMPVIANTAAYRYSQQKTKEETQKEKEQKKALEHLHIYLPNKMPFPDLISTMYQDTNSFASLICGLLSNVFSDFYGAKLEVVNNYRLVGRVFFSYNGNKPGPNQYLALKNINDKSNLNTISDKINAINRITNVSTYRKNYELTDEAKVLLRDIIPNKFFDNNNKKKVNWEQLTKEGSLQTAYGHPKIFLEIEVDLIKIIGIIYGTKSNDGGVWSYQINLGAPINPVNTPMNTVIANKWQVFIMRTNSRDVQEVASQYGFSYDGNNMGIVTK